jgi:hypothetical protein
MNGVVAHVGAGMGAGDAEVLEELGDCLGGHRRPAIGVQCELIAADVVTGERVGDEFLGDLGVLTGFDGPADDVATEDVDDHVAVVVDAPSRPRQFRVGVGPERPARLSPSGFLRPALRTGRATSAASGSPRAHAAGAGAPVVGALDHGVGMRAPR